MFLRKDTFFVTFHRKGDTVRHGDRVDAVGIAVEVEFEHFLRIEVPDVRAETGGVLVFRTIYQNTGPGIRSGLNREVIHAMRAGHGASQPASIRQALCEFFLPHFRIDLVRFGMRTKTEIVSRQKVKVIHHIHNVRCADLAHLILRIVEVCDLFVDALTCLADERHICHAVLIAAHIGEAADDGGNMLITEDAPRTATPSLFEARFFPADVVPGGIDRSNACVLRGLTSSQNRNSPFPLFVAAKLCREEVADEMRIFCFVRIRLDRDLAIITVDKNDHILSRFALNFERIEAGEFKERRKIPADIAINDVTGQRTKRNDG